MPDVLAALAEPTARSLSEAIGRGVALSDAHGKTLARTGAERAFCSLFVHDDATAPPLPSRCESCPRAQAFLAQEADRLPRCPRGEDAVRALVVGGRVAGWIATAIVPGPRTAVERARVQAALEAAAAPLEAAMAAEARAREGNALLVEKVLAARVEAERDVERAKRGLTEIYDALRALREPAA